jgi:hypothetical protein
VNIRHSTTELDTGAQGHYPEWSKVEVHRRNRLIRNIRRLGMRRIAAGEKDAEKIAQSAASF